LAKDELTTQIRMGRVFQGFVEGHIDFPPTYKDEEDSDVYDMSKKRRIPSWTDRILWKYAPDDMYIMRYGCAQNLRLSDHRPVFAHFLVKCRRGTQDNEVDHMVDDVCQCTMM
jgi:phosphatidylinositol-bisphosphatase